MDYDDEVFLTLLRADPDDAAQWSVYADWLEGHGDDQRAAVIRKHLEPVPADPVARLARAQELLTLADGLPRAWLAHLSCTRRIDGECWGAHDENGGVYMFVFAGDGVPPTRTTRRTTAGGCRSARRSHSRCATTTSRTTATRARTAISTEIA